MGAVLVTGGTGGLGRALVSLLRDEDPDQEVQVLSLRSGNGTHGGGLTTGLHLVAATGVVTVVHAASDTHRLGRADPDLTPT